MCEPGCAMLLKMCPGKHMYAGGGGGVGVCGGGGGLGGCFSARRLLPAEARCVLCSDRQERSVRPGAAAIISLGFGPGTHSSWLTNRHTNIHTHTHTHTHTERDPCVSVKCDR